MFRRLVIPTDGSVVASPGTEVSTPNGNLSTTDFLTAHPDPAAAGALHLANSRMIWYRDANSAMSVVAGCSTTDYADVVGEAARFGFIIGLLATRDGKSLFVADSSNCRVREISFERPARKPGRLQRSPVTVSQRIGMELAHGRVCTTRVKCCGFLRVNTRKCSSGAHIKSLD